MGNYILYSLTLFLVTSILGLAAYLTRDRWIPRLPDRLRDIIDNSTTVLYTRLPTSFRDDVESGLHSADFDLSSNIAEGDSRGGLEARATGDIRRIMKVRGLGFDEARSVYMQGQFARKGIGRDGLPNDPKLVTFS